MEIWSKKTTNFFKKNIKKFDSHNMLYDKKILVGYTCLRKLKFREIQDHLNI